MFRWGWILGVCVGAFALQEADLRITTDVRHVLVPVVVTDSKGHHATGLRAEDFAVLEDGVPQKIVSFTAAADASEVASVKGGAPPSGSAATSAVVQDRTYVICFDTLHSSFANFSRVRDALEKLFKQDNGVGAKYVMVSLGRQLRVIQTATSDQKQILARIHDKSFLDVIRGVEAGALAIQLNDTRLRMEQFCKACPCGPAARGSACYTERQDLRQQLNARVENNALLGRAFLEGLKGLTSELSKVPGGRTMILISDGFSMTPGEEFFAVASAYLPNYPEFRFVSETLEPRLRDVLSTASKNDVRFYSVDSRGVDLASFSGGGLNDASNSGAGGSSARNRGGAMMTAMESKQNAIAFSNAGGMSHLATATGGVFFHDSNDLLKDLRAAITDGREYYVLSYVPTNGVQDGKFRRITVGVGNKALVVRAKEGYWAE